MVVGGEKGSQKKKRGRAKPPSSEKQAGTIVKACVRMGGVRSSWSEKNKQAKLGGVDDLWRGQESREGGKGGQRLWSQAQDDGVGQGGESQRANAIRTWSRGRLPQQGGSRGREKDDYVQVKRGKGTHSGTAIRRGTALTPVPHHKNKKKTKNIKHPSSAEK